MTQVFNPLQIKLRHRREVGRDFAQRGGNTRMCWTCQEQKPVKGGKFPGREGRATAMPCYRFRCSDCHDRMIERLQAAAKESG